MAVTDFNVFYLVDSVSNYRDRVRAAIGDARLVAVGKKTDSVRALPNRELFILFAFGNVNHVHLFGFFSATG